MVALVEQHKPALDSLCREFRVRRLELFGSAATSEGPLAESSDLDFLVEFLPLEPGAHADAYFGLLAALEDLFGRPVDLVMTRAITNPYFLESVNRTRTVLYAA
ncbi:MAG TPA: nucleotidyltransferase domain-containing protein [Planctomycetota bacterium]|nr:nucleotidyltransferase domain-containing protein [Planctomycetota bacterium]HRR79673.1 nucleotidyltransferase domain-containing protein [Planctomycetota bacterium]HRT93681.1 nucleotidyltransferase domain-containing protein [Planctomycetota bacterium]